MAQPPGVAGGDGQGSPGHGCSPRWPLRAARSCCNSTPARERETPSSSAASRAVRGVDGLTVSQARSRSRAVSGSRVAVHPLDAQVEAGAAHQQLQGQQQRHRGDAGDRLGGRMVGGVGDVEGGRGGGGAGDQAPGVDGPLAGQGRAQDLDGGGQGEAVDQQRRRPPQAGGEGAGR